MIERENRTAEAARERRALIALTLVPGIGPGRIRGLVARFGSASAALHASWRTLSEVEGVGERLARRIASFEMDGEVDEQLRRAERVQASLLSMDDDRFPEALRQIFDPPAFLWVRGDETVLSRPAVALVGTRRASEYGKQAARRLAADLVARGYVIVSGLAYGIDAAAHEAALEAGGATVAVLGSGVDRIYPASHGRLARSMIESGALVSEFALGAEPDAPNFPRRNRLISGLTLGTIVVEAHGEGGALITARMALEQNREVFAVPGNINSPASKGCNLLIQGGMAKLVDGVEDVLSELPARGPEAERPSEPVLPELTAHESTLYACLGEAPLHIDALCRKASMDPATALVHLLGLEFKGLVRQLGGKQFFRAR